MLLRLRECFFNSSLYYVDVERQNIKRLIQIHKQNLVTFPPIFYDVLLAYIVKLKKAASINIFLYIKYRSTEGQDVKEVMLIPT